METIVNAIKYERDLKSLYLNYIIFWSCFFVFVCSNAFLSTFVPSFFLITQAFQSLALIGMFYSGFYMVQFRVFNDYLGVMLFLYFIWIFFIVFNGFIFEYNWVKGFFLSGYLRYFFPLILFFPKNLRFYKLLFIVIVCSAIGYIFLNFAFFDLVTAHYDTNEANKFTFEGFTRNLGVPLSFLLFTYIYHSKTKVSIVLAAVIVMLLISTFRARRAILAVTVVHLFITGIIFYIYSDKKLMIAIVGSLILFIGGIYGGQFFMNNKDTFFAELVDRNTTDTRSGVEAAFKRDFDFQDWVIGRGIDGKYWCPNIDMNDTTGYRWMIETDYLNIILKGGVIHLILVLLIAIPAFIRALFYSNNLLSKAAGIWIVLWILSLYPMNVFNFDINHLIFWLSVGIGYSKGTRAMSDDQIMMGLK